MADTPLVAAAKRLKFQEMFKDYKLNMFNHVNRDSRNNSIHNLYTLRKTIRRLSYDYFAFHTTDDKSLYITTVKTLVSLLNAKLSEIGQNRKTIRICRDCKESITGRPNRAKPHTPYGICPICSQSGELYNISKTYFHPKIPRTRPQNLVTNIYLQDNL